MLSTLTPSVTRTNDITDFSWKPSSDLVNLDEWLQIAIEVRKEKKRKKLILFSR
jgi:hypothetical protein